ncbi:nucleoside phosphatase family-domain-containing protein [Boletus reticuloceps]|uniref:Nucleoside phosphatase family-domain-containing protein n=1 Tax=Boletus reticuloceps TaxID=495285 RepID=A0A8I2YDW9_9AGAM|nr:nucleoside phosphatase family-domain-containing protein [Boletus reticuloceps]
MPPPTSSDAWLTARRFGIVIDAGSSGSRLQIYSWKDPQTVLEDYGDAVRNVLPKVEKGVQVGEDWITKSSLVRLIPFSFAPGCLSSFGDNPEGVAGYLEPLIRHARTYIPPSLESDTPLFLLATAGMRLLEPLQQARILNAACTYLRTASVFRIESESKDGPCGSSVQIITGEEEGLFGWIAVNYLMDGFVGAEQTTYGFLDMGGASTQIAFEPAEEDVVGNEAALVDVRLRLLGGAEIKHKVFVTTWLGYGTNQARERYVAEVIRDAEAAGMLDDGVDSQQIQDPCLLKDLSLTEKVHSIGGPTVHHTLVGTGSFTQCLQKTAPLLNKDVPCPDAPCLFNGVHVPRINFASSHFIGVSEYWYSSEHVFGLGGLYDFVQYERAATQFCARDWDGIVREHEMSKKAGLLGGDGEVMQNGQVVETGKWGDTVEISRLQMQCFKAAWVANVLHEGIGIPRIVDPGGNSTTEGEKVAQQAEKKGLGRPVFQSVDTVGDIAISWTLGKMVLEASKEVKPLSSYSRPLVDPVQDIPSNLQHPPITPIRPPFLDLDSIEERISQHLPPVLTRASLGFSLVMFLFYSVVLLLLGCIALRLRRPLSTALRRLRRASLMRGVDNAYLMEEGSLSQTTSSWMLLPSLLRPLRRLVSSSHLSRPRPPPLNMTSHPARPTLRHAHSSPASPARVSPTPSHYEPAYVYPPIGASTASQYHSRASSPTLGTVSMPEEGATMVAGVSSLSARSRNASQMSLTTLAPRQMPVMRSGSGGLQVPNGYHHA